MYNWRDATEYRQAMMQDFTCEHAENGEERKAERTPHRSLSPQHVKFDTIYHNQRLGTTVALWQSYSGLIRANVGKRKAFSIGAEKHGVNASPQNEVEHFECCDDDVVTYGEVSEEDIVALLNVKNNFIVDSSSDMEEEKPWPSIADAKTF
ncbi:hypothetical protein AVEN_59332-1 [Araneus ventricosus]|uniref:Uncharacterized protein n=1 Tax=Araneus ventricosus TaxID=182803 RepID=A0A4Y2HP15_ARAVE|nr:hypothetical protein AVEN_59332-1 [Araneus ventricosus]